MFQLIFRCYIGGSVYFAHGDTNHYTWISNEYSDGSPLLFI